ncbi:MAG: extracellular solute-binding protein [Clostridiaceae bacterium]|nr:extracellular solute-binding protein [Clostridiaceae bacterium]
MKKTLILLLILAMLATFAGGCEKAKETVDLKVWGSQEDQAMLQTMIDAFKLENTDAIYNISLGVVGEPDAKARFLEDPAAAADVFSFANDQILDLVNAGALYEVTRNKGDITSANMASSIEAATVNDKLYAYPMTADNGYFLYYDKSVFTEEDVKSLDKMLEVAAAKDKKIFMDVSNGWYIASFFLGAGGTLKIENGKQMCDFNNADGVKAGEAIKAFTAHEAFITGDDAVLTGGMGSTIAAGVSGTWNAEAISSKLGENYAATKLPTFNMGGTQTQMSSFAGFKLVGVNSQTANPVAAMTLAEWLTNEANQITRFTTRKMGPSNIKAAGSDEVKADVALAALAMQNGFAVSQKEVLGSYWPPAEAFGTEMEAKNYTKTVQEMLDAMVAQIQQ